MNEEERLDEIEAGIKRTVLESERNEQVSLPTPGRIVWFTSRTGNYFLPAMVTVTGANLYQPGVEAGHIPDLSSEEHVHLVVFSPGPTPSSMRADATDFVAESPHGRAENQGGTYPEWDIPFDPEGAAGTWRWPTREQ